MPLQQLAALDTVSDAHQRGRELFIAGKTPEGANPYRNFPVSQHYAECQSALKRGYEEAQQGAK